MTEKQREVGPSYCIRTSGGYVCSFHFFGRKAADAFYKTLEDGLYDGHKLKSISLYKMQPLSIGDNVWVSGEGDEVFEVESIIRYSENRYGYALDFGWTEECQKCYLAGSITASHYIIKSRTFG